LLAGWYIGTLAADAATAEAGTTYLHWFLPGLALQFALVAMGSGLRGTGIVKPTMVVQIVTVVINAVLAPVLIAGWLTGRPMGVAGAGLASTLAILAGVLMLWRYFVRLEQYVGFDRTLFRARRAVWVRILKLGVPPGAEFALLFILMGVNYWIIRDFGASAQAGYGVGSRVMQAIFLPAMAVAFATAPLAGQNVGAGLVDRAWETFRKAALLGSVVMLGATLVCQWQPEWFIRLFTTEPDVVAVGAQFLRIISLNFVASGLIFTCSGMFQALGNTIPSLLSGASRLVTFVIPALWISTWPGFTLRQVWGWSVATVALQALTSLWLLRRDLRERTAASAAARAVPS
jgi:putative MATE family efflux protein